MKKNEAKMIATTRAMSVAFRESILEASEVELRQAFQDEGRDLDEEASRAEDVIKRAFQQAGIAFPTSANEWPEHLGELLRLLRRKQNLTEAKLALQAGVPLEDVRRTESDPTFIPSLRTLARLEDYFKLKERTLSILAGAVRIQRDTTQFRVGVERFQWAAFSRRMGKLNRQEKKQLAEIIRFLGDYTK